MLRLTRFIKPYRTPFIIGWLAKLAEAILELFLPLLVAKIIDIGIPQGDKPYILRMGLYLFLLSVAGLAFAAYCQYTAAVASQGTGTRMRHALMEKISTFGYAELDRLETSGLINRITADVNNYQQAVAMTIRLISRAPFLCIGAVILSIRIDPQLTLVFAVVIPLVSLFLYFFMTRTAPLYRAAQKKLDAFASIVRENLSGIRVIRAFARWDTEKQRANHATEELADAYQYVARFSALTNPVTSFIINGGIIALLYFGAIRVYNGNLTRGNILALTTYATQILYSLVIVANLIVLFTKASASSVRILEVLDTEPTLTFLPERVSAFEPTSPAVAFEGVEFSYNNTENALHNLSFSMKQGTTLGIVGVTGSGKTTLINLLQRFYDPTAGEILLGGVPLRQFPQKQLREAIGIVPQKSVLFSGSIAENLKMGKQDATEEEMLAALKTAQALDFVQALPEGIHSPIHEGGKNLSGGQQQRLAIARALVRRPRILIMDDSLSALDYRTDLNLRQALKEDLAESTLIIVSQRISSIASASQILVLDDGEPKGFGTHQQLLESCEAYREIYESQTKPAYGEGGDSHAK